MTIWDSILQLTGKLVSPDWGGLVLLIPLGVLVLVAGYLAWVVRRFATAGPTVSRPLPIAPTPPGIHMPGPSLAPFLVALGAFAFLLSTLFIRIQTAVDPATKQPIVGSTTIVIEPGGVIALVVGLLAMVGALLFWGREANREYDALEPPVALPAAVHEGPPPGIHVPGPSFRPLLISIAAAALVLGLAIAPVVAAAGFVMLVIAGLGWLGDARKEYREVVRADATGHLENIPAPRFPVGTLIVFAVLFVGSLLVAGLSNAPRGGASGGAGGASSPVPASPAPAPTGAASAGPAASGAPSTAPSGAPGQGVTLKISAQNTTYDVSELAAPANTPFTIEFTNNDAGIPHNVSIHKDSPTGAEVFKGEIFNGVGSRTYQVPALPAGTYGFVCSVHPNMTGTLTVK